MPTPDSSAANRQEFTRIVPTEAEIVSLREQVERLREALMRCGALAISERADECLPRARALKIREIAYETCWPEGAI